MAALWNVRAASSVEGKDLCIVARSDLRLVTAVVRAVHKQLKLRRCRQGRHFERRRPKIPKKEKTNLLDAEVSGYCSDVPAGSLGWDSDAEDELQDLDLEAASRKASTARVGWIYPQSSRYLECADSPCGRVFQAINVGIR